MPLSPDTFTINPHCRVSVNHVGLGQHKVVLVDDFYQYPDSVLQLALERPYTDQFEIVGNFPGVRASVNVNTDHIVQAISDFWGMRLYPFFHPQPAVFQGITTQHYRLNIGQRQPHIDQDITAMVYLNPAESCMGGTGLYRHNRIWQVNMFRVFAFCVWTGSSSVRTTVLVVFPHQKRHSRLAEAIATCS